MKITFGCVYWYEVFMNGFNKKVRIPCKAVTVGLHENETTIKFFNPSSAEVEILRVENKRLFEEPI